MNDLARIQSLNNQVLDPNNIYIDAIVHSLRGIRGLIPDPRNY